MKKIKAVFLDIDGTILYSNGELAPELTELIKELNKKINIFISTGRSFNSAYEYGKILGMKKEIISYNGAKISDMLTKETIAENGLPEETVERLIRLSRKEKIHLNLYKDDVYVEQKSKEIDEYTRGFGAHRHLVNFDEFIGQTSVKALFISTPERLVELRKTLETEISNVDYILSHPTYLEILKKGVNKGSAVKEVLKRHNISSDEAAAFGDQWNDYEMLTYVKNGYLMGNAPEDLKAKFEKDMIISTNDENGVFKILEKMI